MRDALVAGLVVGLSVAVFVGAAAMTVMETTIRRGFGVGLAAGAGIATGDALWAAVAAWAGLALSRLLAPWATAIHWIAVGLLAVLLVLAVREVLRRDPPPSVVGLSVAPGRAYGEFLAHTLRHPSTAIFFTSLIVAAAPRYGAAEAAAFVGGVFLASLAWQWVLASAGARRGRPFSHRARRGVLAIDCVVLVLFIVEISARVR